MPGPKVKSALVVNNGGHVHLHLNAPRRKNFGSRRKAGPRVYGPQFIGPLLAGNTRRARATRKNKGVRRVNNSNLLGLAGMKLVGFRKTRSNKGVKRGPKWAPKNVHLFG